MTSQDKEPIIILKRQLLEAEQKLKDRDEENKLEGASETLSALADFLRENHPSLPTAPILIMLKEISDIKNGAKPKIFYQQENEKVGRPSTTADQVINASVVAAIEILMESCGYNKTDALRKVSKELKRTKTTAQLDNMRKKIKSGHIKKENEDLMYKYKRVGAASEKPKGYALALLKVALTFMK